MRNLQVKVKKAFFLPKIVLTCNVWINCSIDLKCFANSRSSVSNFKSFSQSNKQFFLSWTMVYCLLPKLQWFKFLQSTELVTWLISFKVPLQIWCWPTNQKAEFQIFVLELVSQHQIHGGNLKLQVFKKFWAGFLKCYVYSQTIFRSSPSVSTFFSYFRIFLFHY